MTKKPDSDPESFRELMRGVRPLKHATKIFLQSKTPATPGLQERRTAATLRTSATANQLAAEEFIKPVKPYDTLDFKRDGVQHGVYKKLRQGKYAIDSRLDLHRMTVSQARTATLNFVRDCFSHEVRCALITHGRGEGRERPALLKSCVNHWLQQLDEVLAFHSAQPQHGGTGATYLLLRKSEKKREENRERFGSRAKQ